MGRDAAIAIEVPAYLLGLIGRAAQFEAILVTGIVQKVDCLQISEGSDRVIDSRQGAGCGEAGHRLGG